MKYFFRYMICRWNKNRERIYYSKESEQPITLFEALQDADRHTYRHGQDALAKRREINKLIPNTKSPLRAKVVKLTVHVKQETYGRNTFWKIKKDDDDD